MIKYKVPDKHRTPNKSEELIEWIHITNLRSKYYKIADNSAAWLKIQTLNLLIRYFSHYLYVKGKEKETAIFIKNNKLINFTTNIIIS